MEYRELGSLVDRKIGYGIVQPGQSVSGGVPVIKVNNIISGLYEISDLETTTLENDSKHSRTRLNGGELIVSVVGTIGKTAIVPNEFAGCNLVRATALIDIKSKWLTSWVKYYIDSKYGQDYIHQNLNTTVQPTLNIKSLVEMPIPFFDQVYMEKAVGILASIDQRIENNKKINNNLEQQARTLFKSWFVDFAPFDGRMPKEWTPGKLKDILKLNRRSIKAGENKLLPYLPIDVIPMHTFALTEFRPNEEAQSSLITFNKDDIVIGAMRVYFHRVVIAPCDGITRTTCFTLSPYDCNYLAFGLLCCDQESSIEYAQTTSKGSTMPYAVWDGGLGDMEIVIPTEEVASNFNELVMPMIRQIQNSYYENAALRELRDSLLPRLMTGEIDLTDVTI